MKKISLFAILLLIGAITMAQPFEVINWVNIANEPDYAANPYDKKDYIAVYAPAEWSPVSDVATFDDTWSMLGDSAAVANPLNVDGGDIFDLGQVNYSFGAAWKALYDNNNLYVLFKYWDLNAQNDPGADLNLEVMAQTHPDTDMETGRYEPDFVAAGDNVTLQKHSYGRFIELAGGKTLINPAGANQYDASTGLDGGTWGTYGPGILGLITANHFWDNDGAGVIRAVLVMPFDNTLAYPTDPYGDLTQVTPFDPFSTPLPDTIVFDVRSNARVGGDANENRVEYGWSSNANNGYAMNYYSGRLIFTELDVFWPTVTSPVYYCVGETAVPLSAEGTNLTWYASKDGTGQSTPFTPSTDVAGQFTYYVSQTIDGEESIKIPIHVNVQEHAVTISDSVVTCGNTVSFIAQTNYRGNGTEDILWLGDFGEHSGKTFTLSPQQPGMLTVEAGTNTGCAADKSVSVEIMPAVASAEITKVSATLENKNQISWVYHHPDVIDSVFVLGKPDNSLIDYDTLTRLKKSEAETYYMDNRDPEVLGQTLYTLVSKDVCGLLTTMETSPGEHRALQLNASTPDARNWMLQWGNYKGRTVQQFSLYRGSSPENMLPIYTTATNNNFFDIASLEDTAYYRVKAVFENKFPENTQNEAFSNTITADPSNMPAPDTVYVYDTIYITVTDTLMIKVKFTDTNNALSEGKVKIYPNPTKDFISIETIELRNPENYTLKIIGLSGKVVHNGNLTSQNAVLNLADFGARGIYLVELWDDEGIRIAQRKIVLE